MGGLRGVLKCFSGLLDLPPSHACWKQLQRMLRRVLILLREMNQRLNIYTNLYDLHTLENHFGGSTSKKLIMAFGNPISLISDLGSDRDLSS